MTLIGAVKDAIRHCRSETGSRPAHVSDVKEVLACRDRHDPTDLMAAYQRAKRHGEIYEYPTDDGSVVKITDEVLSE